METKELRQDVQCHKSLKLSNVGMQALKSHAGGDKHSRNFG